MDLHWLCQGSALQHVGQRYYYMRGSPEFDRISCLSWLLQSDLDLMLNARTHPLKFERCREDYHGCLCMYLMLLRKDSSHVHNVVAGEFLAYT